jgi:nicotinamidase-related amidase
VKKLKNMKNLLLVIDTQNDFIDGVLGSEQAVDTVPNIVKKIEEFNNGIIITTQDTHETTYMETPEGKSLPVPHCIRGSEGWLLNSDIVNTINSRISLDGISTININKPTFGSIELANVVNNLVRSTDEDVNIEICGFCTDICVVSNAMLIKTMLYDLNRVNISIINDCCAGVTPEKHNAALEVMKSCQINVI